VELKRLIPAPLVVILIRLAVGEMVPSISAGNGESLEGAMVRMTALAKVVEHHRCLLSLMVLGCAAPYP
jgi:hypothetical protein